MKRSFNVLKAAGCVILFFALISNSARAQTNYQRLKSFGLTDTGTLPHTALLLGLDGALYGTTEMGGIANQGTLFRLNRDGTDFTILHQFTTNFDGKNPVGALLQGQDGALYGTTVYGGSNRLGTIFRITTDGMNYAVLYHFSKTTNAGAQFPFGRLVQGTNGMLYGTASLTTNSWPGAIYQLNTNGTGFALLHRLATNNAEGMNPSGLIRGQDGALYGASQRAKGVFGALFKVDPSNGGFTCWTNLPTSGVRAHLNALCQDSNGYLYGTVCDNTNAELIYVLAPTASGYQILHAFQTDGMDGQTPDTQLIIGFDGALYGTTVNGGTNGAGTIFKLNRNGSQYTILYHFQTNNVDGQYPEDSLIQAADGTLYGTTLRGGLSGDGTIYSIQPDGSGYTQLHQFHSFSGEGQIPAGSLAADGSGYLYGVTHRGGNGNYGTLFKIGQDGSDYSVVRHFGGLDDGQWPAGQLLWGRDADWYGATYTGGSNGCGTIFKIQGNGSGYAQLYSFSGTNDGDVPCDALVQNTSGTLFGVTTAGGTNGVGTIFSINTNGGAFNLLHTFLTNGMDASTPSGGLLLGTDGLLYGLTEAGGTNNAGGIYKLKTDGSGYAVLHSFATNNVDGTVPGGSLFQGPDGRLYGTTQFGGTNNAGTVFALATNGNGYAILENFDSSVTNSISTISRGAGELVLANSNLLYGLSYEGGTNNGSGGMLFQIGTNGSGYSVLRNFGSSTVDGIHPSGRLLFAGNSWYGVAEGGGDLNAGALYALVGPPAIVLQPSNQVALAGTSVVFGAAANGSPASYQWYVNSAPVVNGTAVALALFGVERTNAGDYFLVVSNSAGVAISSNAVLTVRVPTVLGSPQITANGMLQLASGYADGWPLTAGDLSRFQAQVSSNLVDWVDLPNALSISNRALVLTDVTATNRPIRFYRLLETP